MIDFSTVTTISLNCNHLPTSNATRCDCFIDLFQNATNLHSLTVHSFAEMVIRTVAGRDIYSLMIQYIDPLKLRHLRIPHVDIDLLRRLLNHFRNLFTICLFSKYPMHYLEEINEYVTALMPKCTISYDSEWIAIWMDRRV